MSLESAADLAVYLADFGVAVTYMGPGGSSSALRGLFDSPTGDSPSYDQAPAELQQRPQLVVRTADLPAGAGQGDRLSFVHPTLGVVASYTVAAPYHDGNGMTRLALEAAQ